MKHKMKISKSARLNIPLYPELAVEQSNEDINRGKHVLACF